MSVFSYANDRDNEYIWMEGEAQRCFATTIKTATKNITNFNSKSSILNYFFYNTSDGLQNYNNNNPTCTSSSGRPAEPQQFIQSRFMGTCEMTKPKDSWEDVKFVTCNYDGA